MKRTGVVLAVIGALLVLALFACANGGGSAEKPATSRTPSASASPVDEDTNVTRTATGLIVETSATVPSNLDRSRETTLRLRAVYARSSNGLTVDVEVTNAGLADVSFSEPVLTLTTTTAKVLSSATGYREIRADSPASPSFGLGAMQHYSKRFKAPLRAHIDSAALFWFENITAQNVRLSDVPVLNR